MRKTVVKFLAAIAVLASSIAAASLQAQPLYLFGHVGAAPVIMTIERDGNSLSGWYFYSDVGKELRLKGSIDGAGAFTLEELLDAKKTGAFAGKLTGSHWSGQWQKPEGGTAVTFAADETTESFASSSEQIHALQRTRTRNTAGHTFIPLSSACSTAKSPS